MQYKYSMTQLGGNHWKHTCCKELFIGGGGTGDIPLPSPKIPTTIIILVIFFCLCMVSEATRSSIRSCKFKYPEGASPQEISEVLLTFDKVNAH